MRLLLPLIFIAVLGCEHIQDCPECPDIECPACPETDKCIKIDCTVKLCDEDME